MQCPICKGKGKYIIYAKDGREVFTICHKCHGSGEVEQTNYDWLNSLPIEEQAEAMANLAFKIATYYNGYRKPDNSLYTKEHWLNWLKEVHKE